MRDSLCSCLYSYVGQPEVVIHELHLVSAEEVRKFQAIEHFSYAQFILARKI